MPALPCPPCASCRKRGRDGTTYSRFHPSNYLSHHLAGIVTAAVFSDAAHIVEEIALLKTRTNQRRDEEGPRRRLTLSSERAARSPTPLNPAGFEPRIPRAPDSGLIVPCVSFPRIKCELTVLLRQVEMSGRGVYPGRKPLG